MNQRIKEVVFLTSFSEGCFKAVPSVAQMADDLPVRLTLLHAFDPRHQRPAAAEAKLASFFPEADRFVGTRRVVCEGPMVAAARSYAERRRVDLFVAPDAERVGLWPVGVSPRAELIETCSAPVWTTGSRGARSSTRPTRRIACWLDLENEGVGYLRRAAELADEVGGELHVLHVVPPIHEGEYHKANAPRRPEQVVAMVGYQLGRDDIALKVHVSPGGYQDAILDLVHACDPDLIVLSPRRSVRRWPLGARVSRLVDRATCPVLCVGAAAEASEARTGRKLEALLAHPGLDVEPSIAVAAPRP